MFDKVNEISADAVAKCRMILNLEAGRVVQGVEGGVVWSHIDGVKLHSHGEYTNNSRYFANEKRLSISSARFKTWDRDQDTEFHCSLIVLGS